MILLHFYLATGYGRKPDHQALTERETKKVRENHATLLASRERMDSLLLLTPCCKMHPANVSCSSSSETQHQGRSISGHIAAPQLPHCLLHQLRRPHVGLQLNPPNLLHPEHSG